MTEFVTAADGVVIAYERAGAAPGAKPAILLIHGFGSSRLQNWKSTGWYRSLDEAGYHLVAMDCRGHGDSGKPHDPALYDTERLARDAALVMDACALPSALVAGYSMGGFIALRLARHWPERVLRLALCGVGEYYLRGPRIDAAETRAALADALTRPDKQNITDQKQMMFREFADQPGKDPLALAACMRAMSPHLPPDVLAGIQMPVLVACGELDDAAGRPEPLAAIFPHGMSVVIPGRNHMSAVGDPATRRAALEFFAG